MSQIPLGRADIFDFRFAIFKNSWADNSVRVDISLCPIEIFAAACQPVLPRDVRAVRRHQA